MVRIWSKVMQFKLNLSDGVQLHLNHSTTCEHSYFTRNTHTWELSYPKQRGVRKETRGGYRTITTTKLGWIQAVPLCRRISSTKWQNEGSRAALRSDLYTRQRPCHQTERRPWARADYRAERARGTHNPILSRRTLRISSGPKGNLGEDYQLL